MSSIIKFIEIRWNTYYGTLHSVIKNFDRLISAVLINDKLFGYVEFLTKNRDNIIKIRKIIKPIAQAILLLEREDRATINESVPTFFNLLNLYEPNPDDCEKILYLKKRASLYLNEKFIISNIHSVACFLDPCWKFRHFPNIYLFKNV